MHLIPGLVMLMAVSGALYKTVEIWSKTEYDAEHDGKKAKAVRAAPGASRAAAKVPGSGEFVAGMAASTGAFGGQSNIY